MMVSSGGVFSEQTGPHEAKMVSLEPQNIPGGHLDIDIWKYRVYLDYKEFGQMVVSVGRGLLGADGSPWGENGAIGTAEHPRGTFGYWYLKILCLSRLNEFGQMVVFVGRGLLGADGFPWGENLSLEPQNIPRGHLDINIWKYCVRLDSKQVGQLVVFVGRGLLGADGSPWGENGVIGTAEHPRGTFGY